MSNHTFPPDDTISDTELSDLPIDVLSSEGLIFLWGTPTDLGRNCIKKWGYQVATTLIKTNKLNETIVNGRTGNWLNHVRETCLVG